MIEPCLCKCGGVPEVYTRYPIKGEMYQGDVICPECGETVHGILRCYDRDRAANDAIEEWNKVMGAKDINVPDKETVIIEPFTTDMNHVGYCKCGYLVNAEWKYCPHCGCRLIWGGADERPYQQRKSIG